MKLKAFTLAEVVQTEPLLITDNGDDGWEIKDDYPHFN